MRTLVCLLMLVAMPPAEAAAARLALVIGVNAYDSLPSLDKAIGDAEAMSAKLDELGFDVTLALNPSRRELNQAVSAFRRALKPGDDAFVHFSGHGVEVAGRNLLLPRDMPIPMNGDEDFLLSEAFDLQELMARVADSGAEVRIFVVDACRNNPFARQGLRGLGEDGGLGMAAPPNGSFVLYSAGFRQTALDRLGPDDSSPTSVYTRVLLERLSVPGASISEIARSVRADVAALARSVGHEQSPAYYDELSQDFIVNAAPTANTALAAGGSPEAQAFDRAKELGTSAAWEAFLKNYPQGVFADLARAAQKAAMGATAPEPAPSEVEAAVGRFEARQRLEGLWEEGRRLVIAGDDVAAFRVLSEAMDVASVHFGNDSLEFADANNRIVGAFTAIGGLEEAIAASRTAIDIYVRLLGESDLRVLVEKANLASRLAATGNRTDALQMFDEILATYEAGELNRSQGESYAHALEGYSQVLADSGELDRARRYAEKAVLTLDKARLAPSINHGWLSLNHAQMLLSSGRCEEAMVALEKAKSAMDGAGVPPTQRDHAVILDHLNQGCR